MSGYHHLLERFWDCSNRRDWQGLQVLLSPELHYRLPQTRERLDSDQSLLELFSTWPGDWECKIEELVVDGVRGVTRIAFHPQRGKPEHELGISFFRFENDVIAEIVEFWPVAYEPPQRLCQALRRY
ncbi:nuclear transport factor 2 family protein [Massilia sp. W12]|uniref:nuclear transport factor 2 family protein n=1 Tax=Massilia sp. W12 TaxID=3126507 RepID=UPI0030D27F5C